MTYTKNIQLHAESKPTFKIACTIIRVIVQEIPTRSLQVLNQIKTKNRNSIFNGRAKLRYSTLQFKLLLSVCMRFFYGQNIEHGYIDVLFNYVIVMRYNTILKIK